MQLGTGAPAIQEMSLCLNEEGEMEAIDMLVFFESEGMCISLSAQTPLGTIYWYGAVYSIGFLGVLLWFSLRRRFRIHRTVFR